MTTETVLEWDGRRLHGVDPAHGGRRGRLLVADSWRVSSGTVRSLLLHYRRFQDSGKLLADPPPLWDYLTAVTRRLPRTGEWFPRIEMLASPSGDISLQLRLRPAPPVNDTARLMTLDRPDPRHHPRQMGPDLSALLQIRRQALMYEADDMVLLNPCRRVVSTTVNAIAWWEGETLCLPPDGPTIFPSVTRSLVLLIADATGVPVRYAQASPEDLAQHEVWILGALHGIRAVRSWQHGAEELPLASTQRHRLWNRRLQLMALPLPVG